ncbi:unconventional prefoldin RPB5 interactor-like isoform X2 [Symsagittifera roscoffensis]|uniref:unconventional prefoldin RPB5 interactor-like isoform X2 n=1 Tax=Symsagittifera roscoffensis TaxID=84072 RepID=UPI00307C704F
MVSKQYHDYDTDDVNLEDFSRLVDKQSDALRQLECDLEKLEQRRAEYSSVKDRLKEVSGKLRCPTMVPLSKVAFMPGELIHTNEVLVLLGDGYFVETTAAKASQIADKRLSLIADRAHSLKQAINLQKNEVQSTKTFVEENSLEGVREVFERLEDKAEVCTSDANAIKGRVSKVKNENEKQELVETLKEKQERIRKGVKEFEEQSLKGHQRAKTEINDSLTVVQTLKPETETSSSVDLDSVACSGAVDRSAILARIEKLMKESKQQDQIDREESDSDDDLEEESDEEEIRNSELDEAKTIESNSVDPKLVKKKIKRSVSFSKDVDIREISPTREEKSVLASASSELKIGSPHEPQTEFVQKTSPTIKAVEDKIVERNISYDPKQTNDSQAETNTDSSISAKPVSLFKKNRKR